MATIIFKNLSFENRTDLLRLFAALKEDKQSGKIDPAPIESILQDRHRTKFWWPSPDEKRAFLKLWQATPPAQRSAHLELQTPWDFMSWLEAIENADVALLRVVLTADGSGRLEFEQLAWPSGGTEALEIVMKVFDAAMVSNDAV